METTAPHLIISLDVGSTTIRSIIYDREANIVGKAEEKLKTICRMVGQCEIDEEIIFDQAVTVIKTSVENAKVTMAAIRCMGITTQRNTFITWDRTTGIPFHHLISWKDQRCKEMVKGVNDSFIVKLFRTASRLGHILTRNPKLLTASKMQFKPSHLSMKLKWMIQTNEKLRNQLNDPLKKKNVLVGTLDTWLLWKLTKDTIYATDFSMASATSLFDPFCMSWSKVLTRLFSIPIHILPPIHETSSTSSFSSTHPSIFGLPIPITAMVADQQASMFGQCCFERGDVKSTLGTGLFIDCNTGEKPVAGCDAYYPLIGWKYGSECSYLVEAYSSNTAVVGEWLCQAGLTDSVTSLSDQASSTLPPSLSSPPSSLLSSSSPPPSSLPLLSSSPSPLSPLSSSPPLLSSSSSKELLKNMLTPPPSPSLSPPPPSSSSPPSSSPPSPSSPPSSSSSSSPPSLDDDYFKKPLCFVGAFSGLQAPTNDDQAGSLLIGLTPTTTANQIVRSALNSIVFQFYWLMGELKKGFGDYRWGEISCDGGVSNNNYILTAISELSGCCINRTKNPDSTSLGCAFLAGLACGIWKDKAELQRLTSIKEKFKPTTTNQPLHHHHHHHHHHQHHHHQHHQHQHHHHHHHQQLEWEYEWWCKASERAMGWFG